MICNICGEKKFDRYKDILNERCCNCNSLGRHRKFCDVLLEEIGDGGECLCVATPNYNHILKQFGYNITNIGKDKRTEDTQIMDITKMNFNDEFDLILCEAILEHVEDEQKALENIYNAMNHTAKLIIYVPFTYNLETDETPYEYSIEHSGELITRTHLRKHGYSFVKKLRDVGFKVKIKRRHFICTK